MHTHLHRNRAAFFEGRASRLYDFAARRLLRPDVRVSGIDLSADMVVAAQRNLRGFGERASARVAFTGTPVLRRAFRTGVPLFRCQRLTMRT